MGCCSNSTQSGLGYLFYHNGQALRILMLLITKVFNFLYCGTEVAKTVAQLMNERNLA